MNKFLCAVVLLGFSLIIRAESMWEVGRIDYPDGGSEVAAFVSAPARTQLQIVLCAEGESETYRFTLLLPQAVPGSEVIEVKIKSDGRSENTVAEISGNSIDFQLDSSIIIGLTQAPDLSFEFKPADALRLQLPASLSVSLQSAAFALRKAASECTALSLKNKFTSSKPLTAAVLWPAQGFNQDKFFAVDELCTRFEQGNYHFILSSGCKLTLDRFYAREGEGPLSFIRDLMQHNPDFKIYTEQWNIAAAAGGGFLDPGMRADGMEWYLMLFALAGGRAVAEFPSSYYQILNFKGDPTTLVYNIDNRYEMEALKYTSVLQRRISTSLKAVTAAEKALNSWTNFYRELCADLPQIKTAYALRPLVYRLMLMRLWRLAGMPQGLKLKPEHAFVQGTGGRTLTGESLEEQCAVFDGMRGDEFFSDSAICRRGIRAQMRTEGLINDEYYAMSQAFADLALHWNNSIFSMHDGADSELKSGFALTMLSLFKLYGFGDYFLLKECLSSRDRDICEFEAGKARNSYVHELSSRVAAISSFSAEDGEALSRLGRSYDVYEARLRDYVSKLEQDGKLPDWRAELILGIARIMQTNALINSRYYREELEVNEQGNSDIDTDQD